MPDYSVELIGGRQELARLAARLAAAPALALDLETVNRWDRAAERVALLQLAFREGNTLLVAVIDALAAHDLEPLRAPLELGAATKAMHNAAFDAVRLARHFRIRTAPIHDTMLAARRGGERRCSLQAQALARLGVRLDKSEQRGDWGRRPLGPEQLRYAALDAICTLLLYEDQVGRGLVGSYRLRQREQRVQSPLPLAGDSRLTPGGEETPAGGSEVSGGEGLSAPALALLGVVTELTGRYGPERLASSAGGERVGLAGWIIDSVLGLDTGLDEETAKLEMGELSERGLVRLTGARRFEATEAGARLWRRLKPGRV